MSITCFIRYEIDPTRRDRFELYARNRGKCIPSCGADLVGYFSPHEGSSSVAYGVYHIDSLAHYEVYRSKLNDHPVAKENYAFAQNERFILREDRLFLRLASVPNVPMHER